MSAQDEQFIEWFLDEDDSVEEVAGEEASSEWDTGTRTRPRCVSFAPQGRSRAAGGFPFWVPVAVLLGALVGVIAAGRFALVPLWLAFAALCLLVREVFLSRGGRTTSALPAGLGAAEPARFEEPPVGAGGLRPPERPGGLSFEPLMRSGIPRRDQEPLSCILVEESDSPGYRNAWVIFTALAVNRSDRPLTVVCDDMELWWSGRRLALAPIDRVCWRIGPYEAAKVSAVSRVWTDENPKILHATASELRVHLDCRTTGIPIEISLRPRVWTSALRPAFSDDGPIHLVPGPIGARRAVRAAV
ncbi:MAG: hypothetical protein V2A58_13785 [Planctomycetota bacterium]